MKRLKLLKKREKQSIIKLPHNDDSARIPHLDLAELDCSVCGSKGMKARSMGWASLIGLDINSNQVGLRFRLVATCVHCGHDNEWRFAIVNDNNKLTNIRKRKDDEGYGIDFWFKG